MGPLKDPAIDKFEDYPNDMPGGSERRRHPRGDHQIRIEFKLKADDHILIGETRNLSPFGVYCSVDRPVPEMTTMLVRLDLPTAQITCEGTVVRSEPGQPSSDSYHLAIFFHNITTEALQQLSDYLAK